MNKLLIIGLDGASPDILESLIEQGNLPAIRRIKDTGSFGNLESTVPPITGPAWFSFATGKNLPRRGIFDLFFPKYGNHRFLPINSQMFVGETLWDILSSSGIRVGVVNFPFLYPPYKINGFMVSGIGSPDDTNITFPKQLKKEIDDVAGGYEIQFPGSILDYDDEELFIADLNRILEKREKTINYLMEEKVWEVFIAVFSCTDWIQHAMWKHIDEKHPLHNSVTSKKHLHNFIEFMNRVDNVISSMIKNSGDDVTSLILSDHGFGPQIGCFNINKWLEMKGYLSMKRRVPTRLKAWASPFLERSYKKIARSRFGNFIPEKIKGLGGSLTEIHRTERIDFEKTKAFTLEHSINLGAVYLNVENMDSDGFLDYDKHKEIKNRILNDLRNLPNDVDERIEVEAFDARDDVRPEYSENIPHIIFGLNNWGCSIITRQDRPLYAHTLYSDRFSGAHRINGIFLAQGPSIREGGKIEKARIFDVMPTIAHMLGLSLSNDVDGKVLKEIFTEKHYA